MWLKTAYTVVLLIFGFTKCVSNAPDYGSEIVFGDDYINDEIPKFHQLSSSFELGGLMTGNRMAGVPLGLSYGDGELDVEGVCSEPGFACQNCSHAVMCVRLPEGWLKLPLQQCPEGQSCNAHRGRCAEDVVPECISVPTEYQHSCEQVGIFPDAYDCRKFHLCAPIEDMMDDRPAYHRTALCPRHYAYNPKIAQCSIKLQNGQCLEKPVPDCQSLGQTAVLPSSPYHYYVCFQKNGDLYPQIFSCPHGWFFIDGFCRQDPYKTPEIDDRTYQEERKQTQEEDKLPQGEVKLPQEEDKLPQEEDKLPPIEGKLIKNVLPQLEDKPEENKPAVVISEYDAAVIGKIPCNSSDFFHKLTPRGGKLEPHTNFVTQEETNLRPNIPFENGRKTIPKNDDFILPFVNNDNTHFEHAVSDSFYPQEPSNVKTNFEVPNPGIHPSSGKLEPHTNFVTKEETNLRPNIPFENGREKSPKRDDFILPFVNNDNTHFEHTVSDSFYPQEPSNVKTYFEVPNPGIHPSSGKLEPHTNFVTQEETNLRPNIPFENGRETIPKNDDFILPFVNNDNTHFEHAVNDSFYPQEPSNVKTYFEVPNPGMHPSSYEPEEPNTTLDPPCSGRIEHCNHHKYKPVSREDNKQFYDHKDFMRVNVGSPEKTPKTKPRVSSNNQVSSGNQKEFEGSSEYKTSKVKIEPFVFSTDKAVTNPPDTFLADKFYLLNYESIESPPAEEEYVSSFESREFW